MADTDDLWDLLAEWEDAHRQGKELAPEDLCRDHPELLDQLQDHIDALKRMDWLFKGDDEATEPEPEPILQPFNIGEYTVLERIGSGGMGTVYKALHRRMERFVALKILPHLSPEAVQRFEQEVKAAAKLSHGNIVAAFDAGESDGKLFLAMELVEGVDLFRFVQEQGPLPTEKAVNYILQAAKGLAFAHAQGITHMDVTPGNLLLGNDGTVKVLDLGLARFKRQDGPNAVAGTVDFMAPDLSQGQSDHRSDIYSLGCCLYFLLTGKPVFSGTTTVQKLLAHREEQAPSLADKKLNAVFRKMVAKRPKDRFQSMDEVIEALRRFSRVKRRPGVWIAASLLMILGAGSWAFFTGNKERPSHPIQELKLQAFNLDSTPTTDADLQRFEGMTDLGELRLSGSKITDAGLIYLKDCQNLRFLDLHHTPITDKGLSHLSGLTNLDHLGLSGTKVTDRGLEHLSGLTKLQHLNLDFTNISDAGLAHLSGLTHLTDLRLTGAKITDDGLKQLKPLTNLRKLDLHHTPITNAGLEHLKELPLLQDVGLAGTKATVFRK